MSFRKAMHVRREMRYWGQFECVKCLSNQSNLKRLKENSCTADEQKKLKKNIEMAELQKKMVTSNDQSLPKWGNEFWTQRKIVVLLFKILPNFTPIQCHRRQFVVLLLLFFITMDMILGKYNIWEKSVFQFVPNAWVHVLSKILLRFKKWLEWWLLYGIQKFENGCFFHGCKSKWPSGVKKFHALSYRGVGKLVTSRRSHLNLSKYEVAGMLCFKNSGS